MIEPKNEKEIEELLRKTLVRGQRSYSEGHISHVFLAVIMFITGLGVGLLSNRLRDREVPTQQMVITSNNK